MGYSIKEVAAALGWNKSRIEKMISRKEFVPENYSKPGVPYGRTWTFNDVVRLTIADKIPASGAGGRAKILADVPFDRLKDRFLMLETLTGPRVRRETKLINGEVLVEELPPENTVRIVRSAELPTLVSNPWSGRVVLISLGNIERQVTDALTAIRPIEEDKPQPSPKTPPRKRQHARPARPSSARSPFEEARA